MNDPSASLIRLYLPLLTHPLPDVRRHTSALLACSYGPRGQEALRRLTQDADSEVRRLARVALQTLATFTGRPAEEPRDVGIYVACLGPLRVHVRGTCLTMRDWSPVEGGRAGWQKVQATFAYLVYCGSHGATRAAIGEAVWDGHASSASVARTISTLRQVLARVCGDEWSDQVLFQVEDRWVLNPALYDTDVRVFEQAYELATELEQSQGLAAAAPLYAQVLDCYTGPYMADVLPGSGWMRARRDLLNSYCVIAAERLAEHAFARAEYRRCALICLQALTADPAADDIVSWLIRAYAQLGHYGELEYVYRSYLREAGLNSVDLLESQDIVLRTYAEVIRSRTAYE